MLPVLETKYHIPRAHPNRVPRLHLFDKLDEGLWHTQGIEFTRRLTLVAAPAGYGKTTLLCEWIHHLEMPVAWFTFDEADNDPGRFIQYLIASLQTISPGIGETILAGFQLPQFTFTHPSISNAMTTLVNEIAAIPQPFIQVFDDFHTLEDQATQQAVTFLLDHMPEKMSLVIATRADPPLPLSRLRARRQLVEVRSDDLRFSVSETDTFLRQVMHLNLKNPEIAILAERTEGWIAGLQMAALALQERLDTAGFIQEFSGRERFVIDYLFEEVLGRQPDFIQTFLIQTSILERLSGPLCDAVLGKLEVVDASLPTALVSLSGSAQQILEYLEHANLFLVALDDERCYYRYHHLFKDLLLHRLNRNFPEKIPDLHLRAAKWFESQNLISDALTHRVAARDINHVILLVEEFGYSFFTQGHFHQMLSWLQQIPDEIIDTKPWLCILYSWGLIFTGKVSKGELYLSSAENILSTVKNTIDPEIKKQLGHVSAVRSCLAVIGLDTSAAVRYANIALQFLPPDDRFTRSMVEYFMISASVSNNPDQAEIELLDSIRSGKEIGNRLITARALCSLANLCKWRGELRRALNLYREAISIATDEQGKPLEVAPIILLGKAGLYYEWDDLSAAKEDLLNAYEYNKINPDVEMTVRILGSLLRIKLAQGNLEAAEQLLLEIEQNYNRGDIDLDSSLLFYRIIFYQAKNNLTMVSRLVDQQDWQLEGKSIYEWVSPVIACSRYLFTTEQSSKAYRLLEESLEKSQALGLRSAILNISMLQALILTVQREPLMAQAKLEQALSLAETEGYIRTFIDGGEQVRSLLMDYRMQIAQKSKAGDPASLRLLTYIGKILAAFPSLSLEEAIKPPSESFAPSILVDPLTARELEILQLINVGLTNKEIAEKLFISVGTVKAHTYSIYRKLDVEGRTKALAKAREIHLL